MHRCLNISEIVSMICDNFFSSKPTLAAVARTCRTFEHSALPVLWYDQWDIVPLLKCMPSDLWEDRGELRYQTLHFRRAPVATDMSRFLLHASWVKILGFSEPPPGRQPLNQRIDVEVFHALSFACSTSTLLPNLERLSWCPKTDAVFPYIRLFLGPKIRYLRLSSEGSKVTRLALLPSLRTMYPSITDMEFRYPMRGPLIPARTTSGITQAVSDLVCGLTFLHNLSSESLNHRAVMHISGIPTLHTLSLNHIQSGDFDKLPSLFLQPGFLSLRNLYIGAQRIPDGARLMHVMMSPLQSLHITAEVHSPCIAWEELHMALQAHCSNLTLQTLHMKEFADNWARSPTSYPISHNALRPLFAFGNLTSISLHPAYGFDIDNYTVKEMAVAWPRVRSLSLGTEHRSIRESRITLRGLLLLAEHCQSLNHLGIIFNTVTDNATTLHGAGRLVVRNHSLRTFHVGDSPISHPPEIALFLSIVFPKITRICTWDDVCGGMFPRPELANGWDQVEDLFRLYVIPRF